MSSDEVVSSAGRSVAGGGGYRVVAIAASAGGVSGLSDLLGALGAKLAVPVLIVQHLDPRHQTVLAEVLARRARMPVKLAEDGEAARPGRVYVAPPDHHLLVEENGRLTLSSSASVHFVRPSADLLFKSAAEVYGSGVIACVLTGTGSDGASGVRAVKDRGGTVVVEDPETAAFGGMPQAAVETGAADHVLPLPEIASKIIGLVEAKRK
ncbi:chemotaxis protein CheB [Phaeacidiphilus oryzae]|uniref:chemotaxis protein CheB n=1 Tax=Phaeacidiphilus oryzae TaxID=348818 RepID=UPI000AAB613F|nr:chemotaxis protein CheB [Phaeacidiphilus oryzae]